MTTVTRFDFNSGRAGLENGPPSRLDPVFVERFARRQDGEVRRLPVLEFPFLSLGQASRRNNFYDQRYAKKTKWGASKKKKRKSKTRVRAGKGAKIKRVKKKKRK